MRLSKQFQFAAETWARTALVVVIGEFLAAGGDVWHIDLRAMTAAVIAGLAKVLMNSLNPNDPRYGIGAADQP